MIKARPTTYRGISMRSRLEARAAADLDQGGYTWTYEPRAYGDTSGQYLPDFEVVGPTVPTFLEIRPTIEGAYLAMAQMPIIWSSEPDALLQIAYPGPLGGWLGWFARGVDRTWRVAP